MEETKSTEDKFSFDLPEVEQTKYTLEQLVEVVNHWAMLKVSDVEIKVEKVGDVCVSCEG